MPVSQSGGIRSPAGHLALNWPQHLEDCFNFYYLLGCSKLLWLDRKTVSERESLVHHCFRSLPKPPFFLLKTNVDKCKLAFLIDSAPTVDILAKLFQCDVFGCKIFRLTASMGENKAITI